MSASLPLPSLDGCPGVGRRVMGVGGLLGAVLPIFDCDPKGRRSQAELAVWQARSKVHGVVPALLNFVRHQMAKAADGRGPSPVLPSAALLVLEMDGAGVEGAHLRFNDMTHHPRLHPRQVQRRSAAQAHSRGTSVQEGPPLSEGVCRPTSTRACPSGPRIDQLHWHVSLLFVRRGSVRRHLLRGKGSVLVTGKRGDMWTFLRNVRIKCHS